MTISTMTMFKFFLDTSALIRLSGLKEEKLEEFKARFNSINAELIVTHVPVDEATFDLKFGEEMSRSGKKVQEYREKVDKALEALRSKGIQVEVETTNISVVGISRVDFSSLATQDIGEFYDELWKEIDACEKAKRPRGKPKDPLSVKRDAVIGVSPLEYSFLITTDKCLCDSFNEMTKKHRELIQRVITPKAKRAKRSPEGVANCILEAFSNK